MEQRQFNSVAIQKSLENFFTKNEITTPNSLPELVRYIALSQNEKQKLKMLPVFIYTLSSILESNIEDYKTKLIFLGFLKEQLASHPYEKEFTDYKKIKEEILDAEIKKDRCKFSKFKTKKDNEGMLTIILNIKNKYQYATLNSQDKQQIYDFRKECIETRDKNVKYQFGVGSAFYTALNKATPKQLAQEFKEAFGDKFKFNQKLDDKFYYFMLKNIPSECLDKVLDMGKELDKESKPESVPLYYIKLAIHALKCAFGLSMKSQVLKQVVQEVKSAYDKDGTNKTPSQQL